MDWIESAGGPLVILEERLLQHWAGIGPADWAPGDGSDYDRACSVDDWIGLLEVGDGSAVVLGSEPARTCIMEAPDGALLVRWIHAPIGWELPAVSILLSQAWNRSATWQVSSASQHIQDAAFAGLDKDTQRLGMGLVPGLYDVLTADHRPDDEVHMVLHRIRAR